MHSTTMNSYFSLTGNTEVTVLSASNVYFPSFNIVPDISAGLLTRSLNPWFSAINTALYPTIFKEFLQKVIRCLTLQTLNAVDEEWRSDFEIGFMEIG
jgi:hypothetical protein